jgi:hypothetical protein
MKKTWVFLLIPLLFSCGEPDSRNREDFEVLIDTVFIESGDELIFHQYGLSHSDLSNDQKRLFNFTTKSELEVIDLDSLKLVHRIVTEKEGPLGTAWPYAIQVDQKGSMVFYGFEEVRIFGPALDSMERYQLTEEALSGLGPEILAPLNPKIADGNFLYAVYETYEQVPQGLAIVSLEERGVKKIPLELTTRIEPYTYSLKSSSKGYEPIHLELVDNRLIVSTAYANEAFVLDLKTDSVTLKTFHSELTPDKKPIPAKTAAETVNEMEELRKEAEKSVKFGRFYFDKTHRRFWRFSRDLDKEIGDSLVFKNVLTVFDENLNQLAETVVPVDPFSKKFFKDGKLWSYVNVEDELGFAVMDLKF